MKKILITSFLSFILTFSAYAGTDGEYNLSKNQAFYFIHNILINDEPANFNNIVLTYCNDNIVGSRVWNGDIIDQPAMGFDGTDKTFGYCEECGDEIGKERLLIRPVTTFCVVCKESLEAEEDNN